LTFDPPTSARQWLLPQGKVVAHILIFLPLLCLFGSGWVFSVGSLFLMTGDHDIPIRTVLKTIFAILVCPVMITVSAEFVLASVVALLGRAMVWVTEDEFWHPQLEAPIKLAHVTTLVIRYRLGVPWIGFHSDEPVVLAYPACGKSLYFSSAALVPG
jgi:hypothetical protein